MADEFWNDKYPSWEAYRDSLTPKGSDMNLVAGMISAIMEDNGRGRHETNSEEDRDYYHKLNNVLREAMTIIKKKAADDR